MERTHLSHIFKFVHGFGQKGHQIGRKVGDALELIVLGMIYRCPELAEHMIIENGIEGATTAKHKVEFAFYKHDADHKPTKQIEDLFGMIECKKVGVEVTIKSSFKKWQALNKKEFWKTDGYVFAQQMSGVEESEVTNEPENSFTLDGESGDKRTIKIAPATTGGNLQISVTYRNSNKAAADKTFFAKEGDKFLITIDTDRNFKLLSNEESLSSIVNPLQSCVIITIQQVNSDTQQIAKILVEDSLAGPQTPEKAKQASFVSLDVRKKVLGYFDKDTERDGFTSVLVIGEASHWERKSRAMVRLCNDYNLIVPDNVIESFFVEMKEHFSEGYQEQMSKALYARDPRIRDITTTVIDRFAGKVMQDMDTSTYKKFGLKSTDGNFCLEVLDL